MNGIICVYLVVSDGYFTSSADATIYVVDTTPPLLTARPSPFKRLARRGLRSPTLPAPRIALTDRSRRSAAARSDEALHRALYSAAWLAYVTDDLPNALALSEEDLALSLRRGDHLTAVLCLHNLSELAVNDNRLDDAAQCVDMLSRLADELGTSVALRHAALARGGLALCRQDAAQARRSYVDALRRSRDLGQRTEAISALCGLAAAAGVEGDDEHCVALLAAAARMTADMGGRPEIYERQVAVILTDVRARMGKPDYAAAWARGQRWDAETIYASALRG